MPIINPLPYILQNGTVADATQVMADFNQIVNNVNANVPLLVQSYTAPIPQALLSGTNLTYTVPLNAAGFLPLYLVVEVVGAGGGGGEGNAAGSGVAGTASVFGGVLTANGGAAGATAGGTPGGGTSTGGNLFNFTGAAGSAPEIEPATSGYFSSGGRGGAGPFGGGAAGGGTGNGSIPAGYGGGGSGGMGATPNNGGSGGGAGGYCKGIISPVLSSYTYTVGVGGAGSSGGGYHGGAGTGGIIIITAHWQ